MPIIHILPHASLCPEGGDIEAPTGTSICEALLDHGIAIEHACEMSCACTTCHVVVKQGYRSLGSPTKSKKICWTRPGGSRQPRGCHARPSWGPRT
jgi:2Fe-2S ferredoxin